MLFRWLLCCCRKMIPTTAPIVSICRSLLHRRDGNRIIRRLCLCLSAPAQNPHKEPVPVLLRIVFSCGTPPFQHLHFIAVKLQCTLPHTLFCTALLFSGSEKRINRYRNDRTVRAEHTHEHWNVSTTKLTIGSSHAANRRQFSIGRPVSLFGRIHNLCISAKLWRIHSQSYSSHSPHRRHARI